MSTRPHTAIHLTCLALVVAITGCAQEEDKSGPEYCLKQFLKASVKRDYDLYLRYGLRAQAAQHKEQTGETQRAEKESGHPVRRARDYFSSHVAILGDMAFSDFREESRKRRYYGFVGVTTEVCRMSCSYRDRGKSERITFTLLLVNDAFRKELPWLLARNGDWVVDR